MLDRLVRHQQVETLRGQDEAVAVLPEDGVPERHRVRLGARRQIEQRSAVARAVPDLPPLVPPQIETQEEPVGQDEIVDGHRRTRLVQDRVLEVRLPDLLVGEPRAPDGEAELVERQVLFGRDGEGQGDDLQVQGAVGTRVPPRRTGRCCP